MLDGELESDAVEGVTNHLASCSECRRVEDDARSLRRQLRAYQVPPDATAQHRALRRILATTKLEARPLRAFWTYGRSLSAISIALVCVVGLTLLYLRRVPAPEGKPLPSWAVARLAGKPQVESEVIGATGRLPRGGWLVTDEASRASVEVADIGRVEVEPGSRLRLVETSEREHRLALAQGKIRAVIFAPPRLFFVETPSALAVDYGCAYTLEVDDAGKSRLRVSAGWVALEADGRESFVPAGAVCATEPGRAPGTPYYEDASASFREALDKFDAAFDDAARAAALSIVLKEARKRDALTLWHLLMRTDSAERLRIYERLTLLAPLPAGVTREGVLNLDTEMLERWKDSFDLVA